MNPIDKQLMVGMIDILNNHSDILSEDQIYLRLTDLKQLEDETRFVFMNSPTCKNKISSVVKINDVYEDNYKISKRCNNVEDIVEFSNNEKMLVYLNVIGENTTITYVDGVMTEFVINNALVNFEGVANVPYKINREGIYIVEGVLYGLNFYVKNAIKEDNTDLKGNLKEAEELGFTVVPNWLATNFDPKNLQSNIEYVYDYANEEELLHDGVVFRFNNISYSRDGIVYEMLNK